jgi:peptidyl-prolyl cis-trans isomerase D
MTMLDRMRRHKNWLKWSLILVCLAFVVFYIPDFIRDPTAEVAATDTVATIEGREISAAEFQRSYQAQLNAYRQAYGGISDQILRQLGVDRQVLQQMIDERAAIIEAERHDIEVSDEEVRQRILSLPGLQENGAFIGEQRYVQLLASQRPPVTPAEFEQSLRQALAVDKLRTIVTGWLSVSDAELDAEYRRRNDKVRLELAILPLDAFRTAVKTTDEEVARYFESHQETFRIPEKRKIQYVLVDAEAIRAKTTLTDAEVEAFYNENFEQYSAPEEIRASHILLRTEGKDEATVRAQAEDLLEQARSGADFAALATKYSEDKASAARGGDLDFFRRGQMVPAFDEAAFALEPNQISDVVRSDFGFHIIKLTERKTSATKSLESVRPQIVEQLSDQRAQAEAAELAERIAAAATEPAALEKAATANGLSVQESPFFAPDEPIPGIGPAPALAARVFALGEKEMSGVMPTPRGPVVSTLTGRQDSYIPKIDEVRERVRAALVNERAMAVARDRAAQSVPRLRTATSFEAAAKMAGFQTETTEAVTRDSPVGSLGTAPAILEAAFNLPAGSVSEPIDTENGSVIVKVVEKQETTAAQLADNRASFRQELLNERQSRAFSAYMTKAKEGMQIRVYYEALQRLVG